VGKIFRLVVKGKGKSKGKIFSVHVVIHTEKAEV